MAKKKDQFIIAYLTDLDDTEVELSYAVFFARKLEKGIILFHVSDKKYTNVGTDEAEKRLKELKQQTEALHSDLHVSYAALSGKTSEIIEALPTLLSAVLVVARIDRHASLRSARSRHALLRNFANCKTAFLTAPLPLGDKNGLNDVAMVVDFKKESKDKFIWSSYFPRFIGSRMHILYYDYKDQFLRDKWYANMKQLHKLYTGLDIQFQPHIIDSRSTFADKNALEYAHSNGYDLLIAVTTKEKDGLEFFVGVQEQRTIVNKYDIPILFLNPREDLYVLCD